MTHSTRTETAVEPPPTGGRVAGRLRRARRLLLGSPLSDLDLQDPNDQGRDLRSAVTRLWRRVLWTNLATLLVALTVSVLPALLAEPGRTEGLEQRWATLLLARSDDLNTSAAAAAVAAFVATFFIAHTMQGASPRANNEDLDARAHNVVLDEVVGFTAFFGAAICWLLVQLPGGAADPRGVSIIIPVAAAFMCSALAALVAKSGDTEYLATLTREVQAANLMRGASVYEERFGVAGQSMDATGVRAWWQRFRVAFPWSPLLTVVAMWTSVVMLFMARAGTFEPARLAAALAIAAFALTWSAVIVSTASDSIVSRCASSRPGPGWPWLPIAGPLGLYLLAGLATVSSNLAAGLLLISFSLVPLLAAVLAMRSERFRRWTAISLGRRAALMTPSASEEDTADPPAAQQPAR